MAGVIEGEHALERAAIVPSVKRKSLKDPARKKRQAKLLLAPRGKVGDDGGKAP